MTALTSAIFNHDLQRIAEVIAADPSQASVRENGWLPLEWAERTGNLVTLARAARLMNLPLPTVSPRAALNKYIAIIAATDFEPIPAARVAEMVWGSVFDGEIHKVDRWQRLLIANPEQVLDIRYLIGLSGVTSVSEFRALIEEA